MRALVNGKYLLDGLVDMPLHGRWTASLRADLQTVSEGMTVTLDAPGLTLKGVARPGRAVVVRDVAHLEVIAGKNGIGAELVPRSYRATKVRSVLSDIARDAGETLSASSTPAVLDRQLGGWMRARGTGGAALEQLLAELPGSPTWRFTDAGELWVGIETWPTVKQTGDIVLERPDSGGGSAGLAFPDGSLRSGVLLLGRRVVRVVHLLKGESFRTEVEFDV